MSTAVGKEVDGDIHSLGCACSICNPCPEAEVLFVFRQWADSSRPEGRTFPCTFFKWPGELSLHAQTGEGHTEAIEKATAILKERGYVVGKMVLMGPTGIYYRVTERGAGGEVGNG